MSNRVYKCDLSTEGIKNVIAQLKFYADVQLPEIADTIVRRLAELGIKVAEYSVYGDWRQLIEFRYEPLGEGQGELIGEDITVVHRIWYTKGGAVAGEADISPLLMSEYGAGSYALAGHRGTFPDQKHAFQQEWFWYDASGIKHSSEEDYHIIATQPMYRALTAMMMNAQKVAREVCRSYGG